MGTVLRRLALVAMLGTFGACGDSPASGDGPTVMVSTSILGDVVSEIVGGSAEVDVVMGRGVDPHEFEPSARAIATMHDADVLVVNGLGFEEALTDEIEAARADGLTVITASDAIEPLRLAGGPDADPHFFTDPVLMAEAVERIADELASALPELRTKSFDERVAAYVARLDSLATRVADLVTDVPEERRLMVTNHEVFGYFADRFGFEIVGVVIPGGTTLAEPGAADLSELADAIEAHDVPALFADTSSPSRLADALAAEGTDVEVVELFSESLGEAGSGAATYVEMVQTNAERIVEALR